MHKEFKEGAILHDTILPVLTSNGVASHIIFKFYQKCIGWSILAGEKQLYSFFLLLLFTTLDADLCVSQALSAKQNNQRSYSHPE